MVNTNPVFFDMLGLKKPEHIPFDIEQQVFGYSIAPTKEESKTESQQKPKPHPIVEALASVGIGATWQRQILSPAFVRHLIKPNAGVKVKSILQAREDLQMALMLKTPPLLCISSGCVAIDLPRADRQVAKFSDYWRPTPLDRLDAAIGVNIEGKLEYINLRNPDTCHLLIGGMTGSGKSVLFQNIYLSIALVHSPEIVQFIVCDPKRVTFPMIRGSAHLAMPVIYDAEQAEKVLCDLIRMMEARYKILEDFECQDIQEYARKTGKILETIIFICDEFADMLDAALDREACEGMLIRLAQKARAAGIVLCLGTQRPDKDVVKPRLRSNLVARIALKVKSEQDSRIILGNDISGDAAALLGKGDLYYDGERLQALYPEESDFAKLPRKAVRAVVFEEIEEAEKIIDLTPSKELCDDLVSISDRKGWLTAAIAKQFSRKFKEMSPDRIREIFQYMADNGIGSTKNSGSDTGITSTLERSKSVATFALASSRIFA